MDRESFQQRGKLTLEEKKFVAWVLAKEAKNIEQEQTKAIDRYGLNRSGIMRNRRTYFIRGAGSWMSGALDISIVKYLRFHDMRRDNIKGGYYTIFGNHEEKATRKRRRQYHLYNKIVFGRMNAIAARLNVGFTEEVKNQLAQEYEIPL